jgi:predicted acetylornithine/succinylornithine family transaminase
MDKETEKLVQSGKRHNSTGYSPVPIIFEKGEGVHLFDSEGNKYLDFLGGIAVNALGYNHPELTATLKEQAERVCHVSNLFYSEPQVELLEKLCDMTFADRAYLCNSGAESTEGGLKLARKYQKDIAEQPDRVEFISMRNSFHGRTMGAITATGQPKYQRGFEPLVPGFKYGEFNDLESVERLVDDKTAGVIVEPIQGEGGIVPAELEFLKGLRRICNESGALLLYDEVQTGMGRTGSLFAYQEYGVQPDILWTAKGLGGGTPIGATIAKQRIFDAWKPGSHATTFGGNPLVSAAGKTVLDVIERDKLTANATERGVQFRKGLESLAEEFDFMTDIRGRGLMLGAECGEYTDDVVEAARQRGLLFNSAGGDTLRFLPPLIIEPEHVETALQRLEGALRDVS